MMRKTTKKKKFKSIQFSLNSSIVPLIIIIFTGITFVSIVNSIKIIEKGLEREMTNQMGKASESIEKNLLRHGSIPATIARTVESSMDTMSIKNFEKLVKKAPTTNENTFGTGIFLEPYKYKKDIKWFAPYAYKNEKGQITYTKDYFKEGSQYTEQEWYKIATYTDRPFVWSKPYKDPVTNILMVTATAPIYDSKGDFMGVATSDIDLTNIQEMVNSIKGHEGGYAFLLNEEGTYLATKDQTKVLNKKITEDENQSLASIGAEVISKELGQVHYVEGTSKNRLYFSRVPEMGWIICVAVPENEIARPVATLTRIIVLIGVIGILLIIGMIVLRIRQLTQPIRPLRKAIQSIADGDFSQKIVISGNSELSEIGQNLDVMQQQLQGMMTGVAATGTDVAASAQQLTASAEQTGYSAQQIAESVQEISISTEKTLQVAKQVSEATHTVEHVIDTIESHIHTVSSSLEITNERAENGNKVIHHAVLKMNEMKEVMRASSDAMNALDETSKLIGGIVDAIKQIANQTNLLALNATIEAARAGEHGKGFAVVADEIRKLSEQSNVSAEQIGQLIAEIQERGKEAVETSKEGVVVVNETVGIVTSAGETFHEIVTSIGESVTQMADVFVRAQEAHEGTSSMTGAVSHMTTTAKKTAEEAQTIAAAAEEQSATMEEINDAIASLANMASELQDNIAKFKV